MPSSTGRSGRCDPSPAVPVLRVLRLRLVRRERPVETRAAGVGLNAWVSRPGRPPLSARVRGILAAALGDQSYPSPARTFCFAAFPVPLFMGGKGDERIRTAVCDLSTICRGFRSAWPASPVSEAERRIRNRRLVPPTIARNPARLPGRGTPCSALGYRSSRCTEPSIWWCRSTPAAFLSTQGVLVPGHSQHKQLRSRESLDIRPDGPNRVIDAARCRGCLRTSLAHPERRGRLHANL